MVLEMPAVCVAPWHSKVMRSPSCLRRLVQASQSGNAPSVSAPCSRGETMTDTGSMAGFTLRLRGTAVKIINCDGMSAPGRCLSVRAGVLGPHLRRFDQLRERRIAAFAAETPFDGQLHRLAEAR